MARPDIELSRGAHTIRKPFAESNHGLPLGGPGFVKRAQDLHATEVLLVQARRTHPTPLIPEVTSPRTK